MKNHVTVLTGGVGGAKLVLGLCHASPPDKITAIVNTGDDFTHLGLAISPDIDTLLYTLSGRSNIEQGWGRADETWSFMQAIRTLGADDWFALGDGDLALHVLRTQRLRERQTLSSIVAGIARAWHIATAILPMSDDRVTTRLSTSEGDFDFQHYFVKHHCSPIIRSVWFDGADTAQAGPGVVEAIRDERVGAIFIAPSNPFLSIDPILAVPSIRRALLDRRAPVIAVSPLVGGDAVKGPTAKIMREMNLEVSASAVSRHYGELVDGWLIDSRDPPCHLEFPHVRVDTLMKTLEDRIRAAHAALKMADSLTTGRIREW